MIRKGCTGRAGLGWSAGNSTGWAKDRGKGRDLVAANASVERLKSLNIHTVYPGHGKPFPMELFIKNH